MRLVALLDEMVNRGLIVARWIPILPGPGCNEACKVCVTKMASDPRSPLMQMTGQHQSFNPIRQSTVQSSPF